jgi:hypothetical protein
MSPTDAQVSTLTVRMSEFLQDIAARKPPVDQVYEGSRAFFCNLFDIGLLLLREPGRRDGADASAFLEIAGRTLSDCFPALDYAVFSYETLIFQPGDIDWIESCTLRSALAFYQEFFPGAPQFDLEELDRALTHKAQFDGFLTPDSIPRGIPESHWWWFAP